MEWKPIRCQARLERKERVYEQRYSVLIPARLLPLPLPPWPVTEAVMPLWLLCIIASQQGVGARGLFMEPFLSFSSACRFVRARAALRRLSGGSGEVAGVYTN